MQSEQLIHQLQQLKLSGMVQALEEQQEKPLNPALSFEECLGLV